MTFVLAEMPYAMDKSNELINLYSARKENPPTELIVGNLSALNVYKTAMLLLLLEY